MSVQVDFTTESKRVNSTKQPTMTVTHNCNFKNGCSMLKPTLFLEIQSDSFPSYTGFKIGNRYYNITDIRSVRANLFEVSGEVDVLATYKQQIGASTQYVLRSASASDPWIIDGKYPAKACPYPTTLYHFTTINNEIAPQNSDGCYVIGVKNGTSNTGLDFFAMDNSDLAALVAYMFGDAWLDATDITVALQKMVCDPMDYISSIYWYPFPATFIGASLSQVINFGYWNATNCQGYRISESKRMYYSHEAKLIASHPQIARGNYLDGAPYTRMSLDCYGFGQIPIDPSFIIRNHTITLGIRIDLFTGLGELAIIGDQGRFGKYQSQMGVPIQLSQLTQDFVKPLFNAVVAAKDLAKEDYLGAGAAFINGLASMLPQMQTSGSTGSKVAYALEPELSVTHLQVTDEGRSMMGRPLGTTRTISSLSGYMECANVDIAIPGTESEKTDLIRFMENGFYYE